MDAVPQNRSHLFNQTSNKNVDIKRGRWKQISKGSVRGENYDDIKPEANNLHIYVHKQTGSKHKNSRLLIEGVENDVKTFNSLKKLI